MRYQLDSCVTSCARRGVRAARCHRTGAMRLAASVRSITAPGVFQSAGTRKIPTKGRLCRARGSKRRCQQSSVADSQKCS
jgi:hypothetical protein